MVSDFDDMRCDLTACRLSQYLENGAVVAAVNISDTPRFQYRGLMVDPARRFLPISSLHAVIDSMSYAKLNVLHVHMTDDQSWPMQSQTYELRVVLCCFHASICDTFYGKLVSWVLTHGIVACHAFGIGFFQIPRARAKRSLFFSFAHLQHYSVAGPCGVCSSSRDPSSA